MFIDIVIPTLNRPKKLERCVNSIIRGTFQDYRLTIVNDVERDQAFSVWNAALRGIWNGYDFPAAFVYLCDDTQLDPDCLANAVRCMKENFPDTAGLVGFNQVNIPPGAEGFSQHAMGMIGLRFAERFSPFAYTYGDVFCPDYKSFHADAELGLFARELGKFKFCEEARLTHYHPAFFKEEMDATHASVRSDGKPARDRDMWNVRQSKGLLWGRTFERVSE